MAVIIDANLLVALVSGDPRGNQVMQQFLDWLDQSVEIHAPELARYEVTNALTRLIVAQAFSADKLQEAWHDLSLLPITYHPLLEASRVVEIALTLVRQNAYDASYLALSKFMGAELWTLDGSLYRNAIGRGFTVRLVT
jgi:predicted nucleic acid-binding protein